MKKVATIEGEPSLSSLVEEVEKGGEVVITRQGQPVAKLVRAHAPQGKLTPEQLAKRRQAIAELQEIAKRVNARATQEEIKSWIEEGRH
jgi:antitoxin (DNA-binding transcriptional repressor) of toxin-antitoxin stability system